MGNRVTQVTHVTSGTVRPYSFETLSAKIALAATEHDLVFIAEQAKTASEPDKKKLRSLWIAKMQEVKGNDRRTNENDR